MVSRHGGDEFIVLLKVNNIDQVKITAKKIINQFSTPFLLQDKSLFTTPSIGISVYPNDGEDKETLVKKADIAMYHAKKQGKNNFQFYSAILEEELPYHSMEMELELRKAINNNEFILHYQPIINKAAMEWQGVEALLRWDHPKLGMIPPGQFLPVVEKTGLTIPVGKWVIRTACRQMKEWEQKGYNQLNVAINVAGIQFQSDTFVETMEEIIEETRVNPRHITIEIVEDVIQDFEKTLSTIQRLKEIGIKLSIDDFGTGYSSLSRLKHLPVDYLKIDKAFIHGIGTHEEVLVKTMIDMGKSLNIQVVAEGIENKEQFQFILDNDCKLGQGYFISKPQPPEIIEEQLKIGVMMK